MEDKKTTQTFSLTLLPITGFCDFLPNGSPKNFVDLLSTRICADCGTQGFINLSHDAIRNGVHTGSVGFQCMHSTFTTNNLDQINISLTITPGMPTKLDFDIGIDANAPNFELKGFYVIPENPTHVPLPQPTIQGSLFTFKFPPSQSGVYYVNLTGFSSSPTAGFFLYSITVKQ